MRIKLDVSPLPNKDGDVWLSLFEDDGQGSGAAASAGGGATGVFSAPVGEVAASPRADLEDSIPF